MWGCESNHSGSALPWPFSLSLNFYTLMGLDTYSIRYHGWLRKNGVRFDSVAMLGRQNFPELSVRTFEKATRRHLADIDFSEVHPFLNYGYTESFYRKLGATVIDSFDISDYEGANRIWDMNQPAPEESRGCYDFVFDGGTLEHVFDFPSALRETLTLVKPGGVFLSTTPANSMLGHGFYQFGPDLPFSILRKENGYELGGVHVVELRNNAKFREVMPPGPDRGRALASTPWPAILCYWGRRIGEVPAKLTAFQPDYQSAWESGSHIERSQESMPLLRRLVSKLPPGPRNDLLRTLKLFYVALTRNGFVDRNTYRKVDDI
jgi:SAM-dependent methyltransferase